MKKSKTQTLVPKLRFPEFREAGAWENKQLGKISDRIREKVGNKTLTPVSITAGVGFVDQAEKFGRDISGKQYKNYTFLRYGDFAYNKGNSKKFPQGYVCQLKEFPEAAASTAFICFQLKCGFEPEFLQGLFDKNAHGIQLAKFITSGARSDGLLNISPEEFFSINLPVTSLPEQQKIAECLTSLDELIAAESQQLDALKAHKKGLMQQLFPREGETTPKLRFPEFQDDGEWEEKAVGNLCETFSGGTPSTSQRGFYGGTIPFIRSAEIAMSSTELFLTEEGFNNSAAKLVQKGDVLFALYGANSGDVAISQLNGAINQAILCLRSKGNNEFLCQYLQFKKEWIISTYIQGGQGNLSGEIIKKIPLSFPGNDEQQCIADFLSSLDDLISAQTEKIETLKLHKKGLMQQLFPHSN